MKALMLAVVLGMFFTTAFAGDEPAHGGDAYASEFIATANRLVELAKTAPPESLSPLTADALADTVASTRVRSMEKVELDGDELDAMNKHQEKSITLSRSRWRGLREESQFAARAGLVLHEYLGIMNVGDSQYTTTLRLVRALGLSEGRQIQAENKSEVTPVVSRAELTKSRAIFGIAAEAGMGRYTGGLGTSNTTSFYNGLRLSWEITEQIAIEASIHLASTQDWMEGLGADAGYVSFDTNLVPILAGVRYAFTTEQGALWHPYLSGGAGVYHRTQRVTGTMNPSLPLSTEGSTDSFGFFLGVGNRFNLYRNQFNLSLDFRYHDIFFGDREETYGGFVAHGSRSGGFLSSVASLEIRL
jgi:hypothetical protein